MFNCEEVIQLLTDYLDGELEPKEQERLERHFGRCPHCESFLKEFRVTIEMTGSIPCGDIPEEVAERLQQFLTEQLRGPEPE